MGMMYLLGQKGQHQDIKRGIDYIRYSADNADENAPQGAYVYAMLLAQELPRVVVPDQLLPNNPTQAKYYLEKSAYLGFSKAQTRMGSAYELQQLNCDFDPIYSLHYNQLAARQGEAEAELAISKWFLSGYDGMFPKNEALAYEYAFRAAKSGLATAEFAIGYFHEIGIYVPSNIAEAKVWYTKAAAHGNEDAEGRITGISRSKTLSRKYHDNMALAKIKSVRGRPNSTQQQSLQMPQIDTYRYPSPTPIGQASQPPTNDHYRTDQYHGPAQALHPYTNPDRPNSRPSPSLYNSQYSNAAAHMQSLRPISTAYAQTPLTAPSSTIPHSNRQSSLPQGYRMSSHGAPVGHSTAVGMDRQNPNGLSAPGSSPITGSTAPTPVRNSYPVDIGYSAPADFSSADRRRMASRPATNLSQQGPKISNTIENPKPALGKQAYSTSHASGPGVHLSKPAPNSKASIVAPTPPLKASITPSAGKKPGNGPSTFAEMGIPQGKQQSDCVSEVLLFSLSLSLCDRL